MVELLENLPWEEGVGSFHLGEEQAQGGPHPFSSTQRVATKRTKAPFSQGAIWRGRGQWVQVALGQVSS